MTKTTYFLIMLVVALFPFMLMTIIVHGSYNKNFLFLLIPISIIVFFTMRKILKKNINYSLKEKCMGGGNNFIKYKYIKSIIASYIIAIVLTAFASFFTLSAGFIEYSKFIDSSSTIIMVCLTIVLIPFVAKFIE